MNRTAIDYVGYTWNPVVGCKYSCPYCYARRLAERGLGEYGQYVKGMRFLPRFFPERLDEPKHAKKPARILVSSMGDLFGDWVPREWIEAVLTVVRECPWHTFLFLTKNPKRYGEFEFPENAWIGTTIEDQEKDERVSLLLAVKAEHYWVSIEPLLGQVDLEPYLVEPSECICANCWQFKAADYEEHRGTCRADATMKPYPNTRACEEFEDIRAEDFESAREWYGRIDWVVVGQQTGPGAVAPAREWVESLIEQCREARVPIWVKKPLYDEFPIQELPAKGEEQ